MKILIENEDDKVRVDILINLVKDNIKKWSGFSPRFFIVPGLLGKIERRRKRLKDILYLLESSKPSGPTKPTLEERVTAIEQRVGMLFEKQHSKDPIKYRWMIDSGNGGI